MNQLFLITGTFWLMFKEKRNISDFALTEQNNIAVKVQTEFSNIQFKSYRITRLVSSLSKLFLQKQLVYQQSTDNNSLPHRFNSCTHALAQIDCYLNLE